MHLSDISCPQDYAFAAHAQAALRVGSSLKATIFPTVSASAASNTPYWHEGKVHGLFIQMLASPSARLQKTRCSKPPAARRSAA
jgi:hypothetical protein